MLFAAIVEARLGCECPAVQDAIDRLAAGFGRGGMLDVIRTGNNDTTGCSRLGMLLLEAWKAEDVLLVTGWSRESWLNQLDGRRGPKASAGGGGRPAGSALP